MGQLPKERVTPDAVFNNVGLDYAGPVYLKQGSVRKPVVVKAYVCVFQLCVLVYKGCTHRSRVRFNFRSFSRLLEEVHLQKREASSTVE